jgi:diguanylate cyclase (GGDEF)-like protein
LVKAASQAGEEPVTLRVRLAVALFVVLLGPAVLGASVVGVLRPRADISVERARVAVRMALLARCQHLQAAAEALAVRLSATGDPFAVTPPNATGPWALCGSAGSGPVRPPPGIWYQGLAARVEVRDAGGVVIAHAYAVQSLDAQFLRELSTASGASVALVPVGEDPEDGDVVPLAVSVEPVAGTDRLPVVLATTLAAGVAASVLAWWLASVAVRPLRLLVRIVEQVVAGDLNARSHLGGRDETGRLSSGLDRLIAEMQETQRLSVTDALTGLGNVRHLGDSLRVEIERASRFGRTLGVLALDLDHFKAVNDGYGHRAGDCVLVEFALRIRGVIREVDLAFRQGGEEFVILLPETDISGSVTAARRIGEAVRERPFEVTHHGHGATSEMTLITVSIGIAVYPHHSRTGPGVLDAADEALYAAKAAGRDRYVLASAISPKQIGPAAPAGSPGGPTPRATPVG